MKISREWLEDSIDLDGLTNDELARKLTSIGHAVESVEPFGADSVFEIEFTSNRIDAMSHHGLARELAAALGRPLLEQPAAITTASSASPSVSITIEAPDLCDRYTGLAIRDVTVRPSSEKIRSRLERAGLRPINNVVDASNYVMLAFGHPSHAFDLDRIEGKKIIVRRARRGESMKSLDGLERKLDEQMLSIADASHTVALGGIIGGANSEIGNATRNVLVECAHFTPGGIRNTARRLAIKTDASYRFERGIDAGDTVQTISEVARIILSEAGGEVGELIDVVASAAPPRRLVLRSKRLEEASAGTAGIAYALELFRRLGFASEPVHDGIAVVVPTWRGDITEEQDLVEEVLRFFGFNNIPASLPRLTTGDVRKEPLAEAEEILRDLLVGCGLTESVSYSFIHPEHNALFSEQRPVSLANALTENLSSMRQSLFPGLLQSVAHNRSYGIRDGALFEVGRIYTWDGDAVKESRRAAAVMFGNMTAHWGDAKRPVDYFDVKGLVESIARHFHVDLRFDSWSAPWVKRGQGARGLARDSVVVSLGFVAREALQPFDLKGEIAFLEIDIEQLVAAVRPWKMTAVSHFPGVPMVLGMLHSPALEYGEIVARIRALEVPYLQEVGMWDRFTPDPARGDEVKTALGMWYQAPDRSLTQEEVADIHRKLSHQIAESLPVKLLGD